MICEECKKETEENYWYIDLKYKNIKKLTDIKLCTECASKITKTSINKMRFLEELYKFRKEQFGKGNRDGEKWTKKQVGIFATRLKKANIPITNYDIPIYEQYGEFEPNAYYRKEIHLHELLGQGKTKIKDPEQEKIDEEIWKEIEENHDKFLEAIGIKDKKKKEK